MYQTQQELVLQRRKVSGVKRTCSEAAVRMLVRTLASKPTSALSVQDFEIGLLKNTTGLLLRELKLN